MIVLKRIALSGSLIERTRRALVHFLLWFLAVFGAEG